MERVEMTLEKEGNKAVVTIIDHSHDNLITPAILASLIRIQEELFLRELENLKEKGMSEEEATKLMAKMTAEYMQGFSNPVSEEQTNNVLSLIKGDK